MKIKKTLSFNSSKNIWRLLLSDTNKLLIQTMDSKTREVFFNYFDSYSGKTILKNYQPDEKYFVGVEAIQNDLIYFHKFAKPDMPNHKGIIAFSVSSKEILWENEELEFYFLLNDKIICRKQLFDSWNYKALDSKSGVCLDEEISYDKLLELRKQQIINGSNILPVNFNNTNPDNRTASDFIEDAINAVDITGYPEYAVCDNLLVFNYHEKQKKGYFDNQFFIVDLVRKKTLYSDKINSGLQNFVPDSFFIKDDLIFILKNKNEVKVLQMKE
ncbi:MAG: DUF4905 domain-containing protein [Melioribacteraceae bacterium]|nr:DUF4905 domain-containing protein [Melioribacteraceae bacterium]